MFAKKNLQQNHLINLPEEAINLYETLRKQVLEAAVRPQGLCTFIYHGMLRGLQMLAERFVETQVISIEKQVESPPSIPLDADLVHLLENLVSSLHPEGRHAY